MAIQSSDSIRLARDLHDGIAQDLVGLGYHLDLALAREDLRSTARREIREARFRVDEIMSAVRAQIFQLRTNSQKPLNRRIEAEIATLNSKVPIRITCEDIRPIFEIEDDLVHIAVELVRNATVHARATQIEVDLYSLNNRTCLEVRDDGVGGAQMKEGRFGLVGISERVAAHGGTLHILHQHGTRATVVM